MQSPTKDTSLNCLPRQRPRGHAAIVESPGRETLPLPLTGLILCGGKSSRMGRQKAFLPFAGKTIIEYLAELAGEMFNEVFLVANEPENFSQLDLDVVKDILPYRGPLGGILSGLLVSNNPHAFVMACDMPLISRRLIRQMAAARHDADVLVLSHQGGIEPLLGIYSKACIKPLEDSLFSGRLKVQDLLSGLTARTFGYKEDSSEGNHLPPYFNINTPQEYSQVLIKTNPNLVRHRPGY